MFHPLCFATTWCRTILRNKKKSIKGCHRRTEPPPMVCFGVNLQRQCGCCCRAQASFLTSVVICRVAYHCGLGSCYGQNSPAAQAYASTLTKCHSLINMHVFAQYAFVRWGVGIIRLNLRCPKYMCDNFAQRAYHVC